MAGAGRQLFHCGGHRGGCVGLAHCGFGHLGGYLTDVIGVADQLVGAAVDLADHTAQGGDHRTEGVEHAAVGRLLEAGGEVAVGSLPHDVRGVLGFAAELTGDARTDPPAGVAKNAQQHAGDAAQHQGDGTEGGIHVVDVDAGADNPTPRCKGGGVGQFGMGFGIAGLGKPVIDESAPARGGLHQFPDNQFAVGVFEVACVAAFLRRLGRQQDEVVVGRYDEQVVAVVVAHHPQGFGGGFFGLGLGQLAGLGQSMEVLDHPHAVFDNVLCLQLAVVHHAGPQVGEADGAQGDQSDHRQRDEQAHAGSNAQVGELHGFRSPQSPVCGRIAWPPCLSTRRSPKKIGFAVFLGAFIVVLTVAHSPT